MDWITIVFVIAYIICWMSVVRYDVQMFQQNSYRYGRYWTWLKNGNILGHRRWWFIPLLAAAFHPYLTLACAVVMIVHAILEFRTAYKVKVVYTARVKRLLAADAVVNIVILCAIYLLFGAKAFVLAAVLALLLSKILLMVSDFLMKPVESQVNKYYINDARRILESHKDLLIIGVTGSFGKTSTKNALYRVLSEKYNVLMTPGNFNTTLGVVRTVREHLKPFHQVFIVEMGAKQRGDIKEICDLVHPKIGIVSSVGNMHLETFKTLRGVQDTKFELINSLPADGIGVINIDSEGIASYPDIPSHCRIIRYGINSESADSRAEDISYSRRGVSFNAVISGKQPYGIETRLMGDGNILNILAALTVADCLGVPQKQQRSAMASLQPVEHRLSISNKGGLTVLDDAYNSNPTGARMALSVLRKIADDAGGKAIIITPGFVEMGSSQEEANRGLGRDIAASADKAVIVNRYNRQAITEGLAEGGFKEEDMYCVDSLDQAVALLAGMSSPGDVVLYENDLPDTFK